MLTKLGAGVVRHPVLVILGWLLVIGGLVVGQSALYGDQGPDPAAEQSDFLPDSYDSVRAAKIAERAFPTPDVASATLVVWRADGGALTAADTQRAEQAVENLAVDGVGEVELGPVAPNGLIQLGQAAFTEDLTEAAQPQAVTDLRTATKAALAGSGLAAGYTGDAAALADDKWGSVFELAMIVVIVALLLIIFRSPIIALVNMVIMAATAIGASAALSIGAKIFDFTIDETTSSILPVVLLGVGTDYAVFLLFRFREQLRRGAHSKAAMAHAVGGVGEAVGVSALVVAVSFGALLLSDFGAFRLLGPALAFAVLFMVTVALTLMPAVYSLIGRPAYWPMKLREPRRLGLAGHTGRLVARRPLATAIVAVAVLGALGTGALTMNSSYEAPDMPSGSESAQAMDRVQAAFPAGVLTPTSVFLTGPGLTEETAKAYAEKLTEVPIVGAVGGVTIAGDVAQVDLQLTADPTSEQAMNAVRDDLRPAAAAAAPPGTEVAVGGTTAALVDVRTVIDRDLPIIFAVAAGLIGLLLLLMLRGLVAPLYLLGAVALGFIGTLGASTVAFQQLADKPGVGWQTPLIVYLFVTAIGTDYNILMIARIREELRAGRTPREAAAEALRHAGPSVAAAGFILAGSFAVLMLSPSTQEIGFAVAVGVLFSTFVLSWLLVPALTALFGRAAFWPSRAVPRDSGRHAVERTDELVLSGR